jgi:hypothetical protein
VRRDQFTTIVGRVVVVDLTQASGAEFTVEQ